MLALRVLLLDQLLVEQQALAALALEVGIAAAIERELAWLPDDRIWSTALSSRSRSWLMMIIVRG